LRAAWKIRDEEAKQLLGEISNMPWMSAAPFVEAGRWRGSLLLSTPCIYIFIYSLAQTASKSQ